MGSLKDFFNMCRWFYFLYSTIIVGIVSSEECPDGWTYFPGTTLELDCLPTSLPELYNVLQGTCPDGFIDSSFLNEDIGCLLFMDDLPTVSAQAKFFCEQYNDGETFGGAPGGAHMQKVEAIDLQKAKDLMTLAHLVQQDRTAWWLGLSYWKAASGFAWDSATDTKINEAMFSSIFTPDDTTPSADNSLCVLMSYEDGEVKWDDVSCWQSTYGSSGVGAVCQCTGDTCPANAAVTDDPPTDSPPVSSDCLNDWLTVAGLGCVQIISDATGLSYEGANSKCQGLGGYLVEIESEAQITELQKKEELLQMISGVDTFWIGATDALLENIWYNTVSETALPSSVIPWYDGSNGGAKQPDGKKSENCLIATLNTNQGPGWFDVPCDSTTFEGRDITPICMEASGSSESTTDDTASTTEDSTTTDDDGGLPADCKYMPGVNSPCYLYTTEAKSYSDAQTSCQTQGGELASALTQAENDFIGETVIQYESVWLGAKGSGSGGFTWADSSTWSWTNWRSGEPGTSATQECVFMSASTWQWSAYDCTYPLGFVCKLT